MDSSLVEEWGLSSANSINLGRLLPQVVYAFYTALEVFHQLVQCPLSSSPVECWYSCVPTGQRDGSPYKQIVLASMPTVPFWTI